MTTSERAFVERVLPESHRATILAQIEICEVVEMHDGRMGSLQVVGGVGRSFGGLVAERWCRDADNTPVSIGVIVDQNDMLFEVDVWRVDFQPLLRFPGLDDCD